MDKILLLLFITFFAISKNTGYSQGIVDPSDPIVSYDEDNPPTIPNWGMISKWVVTPRLNWNTESYKAYYYKGMAFRLKFPKSYQHDVADGKKYPIIIMLHGRGERGSIYDNEWSLKHGGKNHRDAVDKGDFDGFILYPQSQNGYWGDHYFKPVVELLDFFAENIKLDLNRVNVHGLSAGGQGTWEIISKYPKVFSSAIPMSASSPIYEEGIEKYKYIPIWLSQGGKDNAPTPFTSENLVNSIESAGGNIRYTLYPNLGHGVWNTHYAESDFFPFMLRANKTNPHVFFRQTNFCPGDPINLKLGFTKGFENYEWRKDGIIISGENSNEITVTSFGTYDGRFMRNGIWSQWSEIPVIIQEKQPTITPPIQVSGLKSKVIPAPDGSVSVPLEVPEGFTEYKWKKVDSEDVLGTSRILNVTTPGDYIVTVKEEFGCSSNYSLPFNVINADNTTGVPEPPINLRAIGLNKTNIELNWVDNPSPVNNESGFEIYRSTTSGGPFTLIHITEPDILTFNDSNLEANTEYFYILRAINESGASDITSEESAITQFDNVPPSAPKNLKIVGTTPNTIDLEWDPATDDIGVDKYDIYINGEKSYVTNETTFQVFNLNHKETYSFSVKARDFTGNISPSSSQVSGTASINGLSYKYYHGEWDKLPDFKNLTPEATGVSENIDINVRTVNDKFGFLWTGFINIPVAGNYTFETRSDDGSKLYIGEYDEANLLVNNDGLHGMIYREGTYNFPLAGSYPIAITFFEKSSGQGMEVYWKNTAHGVTSRQKIPNNAFAENIVLPEEAPTQPINVISSPISYQQIDIVWTDNSDNETGFEIYRSTNPYGPFEIIHTTPPNVVFYSDKNVQPETSYTYKVRSINKYGESEFSDDDKLLSYKYFEESVFENYKTDNGPVDPNGNANYPDFEIFNAKKTGIAENIDLSLRDKEDNFGFLFEGFLDVPIAGEYIFYISSNNGSELYINGQKIFLCPWYCPDEIAVPVYLNQGSNAIKFTYYEKSSSQFVNVKYEGPAGSGITKQNIPNIAFRYLDREATTYSLPPIPTVPGNLNAEASSTSSINLNWDDSDDNEDYFEVFRSVSDRNNYKLLATLPRNNTAYIDSGLFANVSYFYKIQSKNVAGSIGFSNETNAKTRNNLPELDEVGNLTIRFDSELYINLFASDIDGELLEYTITNLPSFATFTDYGDGSGLILFTPLEEDQGLYQNIIISISDQNGGSDNDTINININNNYQPILNVIDSVITFENNSEQISLEVTDQNEEDVVTWSPLNLPSFASFIPKNDGTATLELKPSYIDAGYYSIDIKVEDGKGGVDIKTIAITVEDIDPNYSIFINFNKDNPANTPWNNTNKDPEPNDYFSNLIDNNNKTTSIGMSIISNWQANGSNNLGMNPSDDSGIYPSKVIQSAWWVGNYAQTLEIFGLDSNLTYDFTFFGSRNANGNRSTDYTINANLVSLEASYNISNTVSINQISPNENGEILITIEKNEASSYGYINSMVIKANYDDGNAPGTPRGLIAENITNTGIQLSWEDVAFNESGYEVYRANQSNGSFLLLTSLFADSNSFTDTDVDGNSTFFYKVKAINKNGDSDYSNTVSITTDNNAPILTSIGHLSMKSDTVINVNVLATDDHGDVLTLTAQGLPSFVSFIDLGNGNGILTLSPTEANIGTFENIKITAADNKGKGVTEEFSIIVKDKNLTSVLVNFNNGENASFPWNNFDKNPTSGSYLTNLLDETNSNSGINITLNQTWGDGKANNLGVITGDNSGIFPDKVMKTAYWEGSSSEKTITVSGLKSEFKYNFVFFGSRDGGGNRTTEYSINTSSVTLDAAFNSQNTAQLNGISVDENGSVTISIKKAPGASYGYLNAMVIQSYINNGLPLKPGSLTAKSKSKTSINLTWADNSGNETSFELWRANSENGVYNVLSVLGPDVITYTDTALTADTRYFYKVKAIRDGFGSSDFSNITSAKTLKYSVSLNFNWYDPEPSPWNNTNTNPQELDRFINLVDESKNNTGIAVTILDNFDGENPYGMNTENNSGVVPDNVMRSSYWLDIGNTAKLKIEGLNQALSYSFEFFASRNGAGNRTTEYVINEQSVSLNAVYNTNNTVQIDNISPDINGEVIIDIGLADGATFGYINSLIIKAYTSEENNQRIASNSAENSFQRIKVYPNPFRDQLSINLESFQNSAIHIELFDMAGRKVLQKIFNYPGVGEHLITFDINNQRIGSGIYILKVYSDDINQSFKLVKE